MLTLIRNKSGGISQEISDFSELFFGVFVGLHAQFETSFGSQEASCAVDEFKAEGAYGFEGPSVGIFPGAIAFCQAGFNLEVDQEVVRENDELLPGAVGVVILRGNGIETESGLEFANGFFVHATACDEAPERAHLEG